MSIVAAFDRVLFCNPASKYCVLRLKTADLMIPEDARSPYTFGDHLIRFTAVGYDLPRTDSIKMERGQRASMAASFRWTGGMRSCHPLLRASGAICPPAC